MHALYSSALVLIDVLPVTPRLVCAGNVGRLVYTVTSSPFAWQLVPGERLDASTPLTFFIALRQQNLDELERMFWAVSDPTSSQYLDFMTAEDIQALVSPPEADKAMVKQWLSSTALSAPPVVVDYGDSFEVRTTVEAASMLLNCSFHSFRHRESGQRVVRAWGDVFLPVSVFPFISTLFGISDFPVLRYSSHLRQPSLVVENDAIIPQTIHDMYGTPANQSTKGDANVSLGVIEWGQTQSFSPQDLDWFSGNVSLPGRPRFPDSQIIGTNVPASSGGEASLDVDVIAGVAPSNSLWFWIEAGEAWLYTFTVHFLATARVPDVISISYGAYEGGQCFSAGRGNQSECGSLGVDSYGYVHVVNTQWMKIGLRGVSVMVSSGDSGAHTRSDPNCTQPHLWADYPASSPYITSVGATQAETERFFPSDIAPACHDSRNWSCVSYGTESAVNLTRAHFTSGGGFSNISAQADYGKSVVNAFLSTSKQLPPASYYNASGRAYPDVSALGHNWFVVNRGRQALSGGTSQSSPIFAAVVSLLLQTFKNVTGKPFGFINPLLYRMYEDQPDTFNDVLTGDNVCTEHGCHSGCTGWHATKGWDPVSHRTPIQSNARSPRAQLYCTDFVLISASTWLTCGR